MLGSTEKDAPVDTQIKCSAGFGPGIHFDVTFDPATNWLHVQDLYGWYAEGIAVKSLSSVKGSSYFLSYGFNLGALFFTDPKPMAFCIQANECYTCN
jgi:hypothetical protein